MIIYRGFDRLLSFASVHHAIRAEKLLLAAGIIVASVPTPREIDISCGHSLLFAATDQHKALIILQDHQVLWSKLFKCNIQDRVYEELESR
ncbi:MAG: hypothetical protein H6Q68_3239 [Firmicutes bacterium]|nr:hypothetical protein [Bacillota bacterium]